MTEIVRCGSQKRAAINLGISYLTLQSHCRTVSVKMNMRGDKLSKYLAWDRWLQHKTYAFVLAPFAALLQRHNNSGADNVPVFGINDATITLGHLRRAAELQKGPPQ